MRDLSNNKLNQVDNFYWMRETYDDGIPLDCKGLFYRKLNKLIAYNKEIIDGIIAGRPIRLPMETDWIEEYLTGFKINYIGFDAGFFSPVEGYWEFDEENRGIINVYYNIRRPKTRQRFTKIHETVHAMQAIDIKFQDFFDEVMNDAILPPLIIKRLLEKTTDKTTAMYLAPNDYVRKKYKVVKDINKLAGIFQISPQSMSYRLKECGLNI